MKGARYSPPMPSGTFQRAVSEYAFERHFGLQYNALLRNTPTPEAPEPLDENPAPTPAAVEPME